MHIVAAAILQHCSTHACPPRPSKLQLKAGTAASSTAPVRAVTLPLLAAAAFAAAVGALLAPLALAANSPVLPELLNRCGDKGAALDALERVLEKGLPPRAEFVASADYEDVNSTYWRGLVTSVENEWYGTQAGSVVDVLILQSNYPSDIVKTVVEADNANWFFTNVYGPLAASQAAGAAPIIQAWLAGEELPAVFP